VKNNSIEPDHGTSPASQALRKWAFRALLLISLAAMVVLAWFALQSQATPSGVTSDPTLIALATSLANTSTPSLTPSEMPPSPTSFSSPSLSDEEEIGTIVFARRSEGRSHLWAYQAGATGPVQITDGDFDDRDPAISPDGSTIAFVSSRSGPWELYLLDLNSMGVRKLTDTPGYVGSPTWSPDGRWLAFEMYHDQNFDIWVMPLDSAQEVFQLTNHPAMDIDPAWDPNGRRIAFVSDREGQNDVFLADLDRPDERFFNLTRSESIVEGEPAFSPGGRFLLYTVKSSSPRKLLVQDMEALDAPPSFAGNSNAASWAPDESAITGIIDSPGGGYLVVYPQTEAGSRFIGLPLGSGLEGIAWSPETPLLQSASDPSSGTSTPLYQVQIEPPEMGIDRMKLSELIGVDAPNAYLSDAADEAFNALRERAAPELGWDFLARLENAFVGLNDPVRAGMPYDDWLYTGRAFAFDQDAVQAGWVEFIREDFEGQTFWQVFVRTSVQDGSSGEPLRERPWDFNARFAGTPAAYDQGGQLKDSIPAGYYVDFTRLAADFGFERVPSLPNWRSYYYASRFNEFAFREGLTWEAAMLQLYPASAIITPTPFRTPTPTPTRTPRPTPTPWWWRWNTPTP
jgi:TolB protein